jgi:hypothetical protein
MEEKFAVSNGDILVVNQRESHFLYAFRKDFLPTILSDGDIFTVIDTTQGITPWVNCKREEFTILFDGELLSLSRNLLITTTTIDPPFKRVSR